MTLLINASRPAVLKPNQRQVLQKKSSRRVFKVQDSRPRDDATVP
ncbi:rCG45304 [Rattus norvegicus]|uniref:RCG45304 n=1 Tax=Rattus norvegicus TaxID=10116 RepID=A6K995_RAT|nr:rCG45304 [Rattus norvegicus]